MGSDVARRAFLGVAGAAVAGAAAQAAAAEAPAEAPSAKGIKIIGIACSPRKGKTTAAALAVALEAAKEAGPDVEVELIELAGLKIGGAEALVGGASAEDDFPKLAAKLTDPRVAGILVGSPVYFGSMSSLGKAMFERWTMFRRGFALRNKVGGALAVGGNRNGGQELTNQGIHAAMLGQDMILVGDGRPTSHLGATLWNQGDDITKDEGGLATAKNLGRRVAEAALRMAGTAK